MAAPSPPLARSWRPLATRLLVVAGAVALGLALQQVLAARLAALQELAETDVLAARRELAFVFRAVAIGLFGLTGGLGIAIVLSCRRALAEGRFPPSGALAWGRARAVVTGPRAQRLAQTGLVLGALLVLCSAAGGGLLWWMARTLLLCRAGVG
jgi:hypothetical protein